ncbi:MAG: hypothetical protein IPH44_00515 [Myxococcales bacterium]|nr:hypothetical protein [Myxococcales bacterium]MBK7197790.1 hypothetical protein [Myxococcales bacterium]
MTDDDDATLDRMLAQVRAAPTPLADATRADVLAQVLAAPRATPAVDPIAAASRRRAWAVGAGVAVAAAAALALWIVARPPAAPAPAAPPVGAGSTGVGAGSHAGPAAGSGGAMAGGGSGGAMAGSGSGSGGGSAALDGAAVARQLLRLGYLELFQRADDRAIASLYPGAAAQLAALADDPMVDPHARFLAAEILFVRQPGYPAPALRPALAEVYASALGRTYGQVRGGWLPANAWGLAYDLDDVGATGRHLLALGPAAIPALRALLDRAEVVQYEGSEDATVGNARGYRVKDLAAYFIARLAGLPLAFHPAPADRDRAIASLVASLP